MPSSRNRIDIDVGFRADTAGLQKVKQALQQIQNMKFGDFSGPRGQLTQIISTASKVEVALENAFNPNLNALNIEKFNSNLKQSGLTLDQVYANFSKIGARGQAAFSSVARSVLTTNVSLKQTSNFLNKIGQTMVNTVKWGVTSRIFNNITQSVRQAFTYVKSLDSALNDIRIVTGASADEMDRFANQANRAAQELGRSTMDYTKAALTFYQQGLSDEDVQARTQATLKAQNITGAGQQMADYLTAVWNGYKVANEEAELYVDKLAAVADHSASNMSQLAVAMSKVASSANALNVPVDSLNAQIATIVATTRQAPESVGNALKTIYARINDIKLGTDDAQTSLGNYSSQMAKLGFSVLDANGNLRDTGDVIEQIGGQWANLSREQQIFLARTMAGQRQYNNLIALFDNWGKYTDLVTVSMQSQGATAQKNAIYLDSLAAHTERLGAAQERLKSSLVDSSSYKNLIDFGTSFVNIFSTFIESIGGGGNALLLLAGSLTSIFSGAISKEINSIVTNIQNAKYNIQQTQNYVKSISTDMASDAYQKGTITQMINAKKEVIGIYASLSEEQKKQYNQTINNIGIAKQHVLVLDQQKRKAEEFSNSLKQVAQNNGVDLADQFVIINQEVERLGTTINQLKGLEITDIIKGVDSKDYLGQLQEQVEAIKKSVGQDVSPKLFDNFQQALNKFLASDGPLTAEQFYAIKNAANSIFEEINTNNGLALQLNEISAEAEKAHSSLDLAIQDAKNLRQNFQQGINIESTVKAIGDLGRIAGSLSSLKNLFNIWSDDSISGGEKLLKTLTSLGTMLPMLVTAYKSLKQQTLKLSQARLAGTAITEAQTAAEKASLAVEQANNKLLLAREQLERVKNSSKFDEIIYEQNYRNALEEVTKAEKNLENATNQADAAQQNLSKTMSANPIGKWVTGIGAAIAAITLIVSLIEKFTMSLEQAQQAVDNFNEKQKELQSNTKTYAQQSSSLKEISSEYQQLAKKASAISFDSNIDQLTEKERERYNQLKNLIAEYNADAVAGYNEQGQAILVNNNALQQTIDLLKEKHQLEIDQTYSGDQFRDAEKGRRILYEQAQDEYQNYLSQAQNDSLKNQIISSINVNLPGWRSDINFANLGEQLEKYRDVLTTNADEIVNNWDEYSKKLSQAILAAEGKNQQALLSYRESLESSMQPLLKLDFNVKAAEEKVQQAAQINLSSVLGVLQTTQNITQYTKQVEVYGQETLNAIISSYVEGFSLADPGIQGAEDVAEKVLNDLFANLDAAGITSQAFTEIQKQVSNAVKDVDFSTVPANKYKEQILDIINAVIESNDQLQALAESNPEILANILNALFGISGIEISGNVAIDFDTKEIEDKVTDAENLVRKKIIERRQDETVPDNLRLITRIDVEWVGDLSQSQLQQLPQVLQFIPKNIPITFTAYEEGKQIYDKYTKLGEGITGITTAQKLQAGESVGDQQLDAMTSQLEVFTSYSNIAEAAYKTLQTTWLQGTDTYQQAIDTMVDEAIKGTQKMLEDEQITSQQAAQQILPLITNISALEQAYSAGILQGQDYQNALGNLGVQYQNCKDQLQDYYNAIQSGDEQTIQLAEDALKLAIAEEEAAQGAQQLANALDSDINADQFEKLVKYLQSLSDEELRAKGFSDTLNDDQEAARRVAQQVLRYAHAIKELESNYDDWSSKLGNWDDLPIDQQAALAGDLQNIYGDILGIDGNILGEDFYKDINNLNLLKAAAQGSEEALNSLRQAAAHQYLIDIGIDQTKIANFQNIIGNILDHYHIPDIEIGAKFDGSQAMAALSSYVNAVGMSANQAQDYFSQMGYDIEIVPHEIIDEDDYVELPNDPRLLTSNQMGGSAAYQIMTNPQLAPVRQNLTQRRTFYALKSITKKGTSGGNAISSSGGGGGGGGAKSTPKHSTQKASNVKTKINTPNTKSQLDPYETINNAIEKQGQLIDDLKDKEDRLTGKERLENLQKQNQQIKNQIDLEKQRLDVSALKNREGTTRNLLSQLQNNSYWSKYIGVNATDRNKYLSSSHITLPDGTTYNYGQITDPYTLRVLSENDRNRKIQKAYKDYQKEYKKYEAARKIQQANVEWWNNLSAEDQAKEANKEQRQKRKEQYEAAVSALEEAEKTYNDIKQAAQAQHEQRMKLLDDYINAYNEDIQTIKEQAELLKQYWQNNLSMLEIRVQANINIGQLERDYLELEEKILKHSDKNYDSRLKKLRTYYQSRELQAATTSINQMQRALEVARKKNQGKNLTEAEKGILEKWGDDEARIQQIISNNMQTIASGLTEIYDIVQDIHQSYLDAAKQYIDSLDKYADGYQKILDVIDNTSSIAEILYGENPTIRSGFYVKQLYYNREYLKKLQENYKLAQQNMNDESLDEETRKEWRNKFYDFGTQLQQQMSTSLQFAVDQFENNLERAVQNVSKNLKINLDKADLQWDAQQKIDDRFLDDVNSKYAQDSIARLYQNAVDAAAGDVSQQQRLKSVMQQQLKILKDKDKLTQYDVDRAKKVLQLEKARMALEDARNNKTKMRLRRDSQGNYRYEYVADETAVNDLEQKVADLENDLYNFDKDQFEKNLKDLRDVYEDYLNQRAELEKQLRQAATEDERKAVEDRIKTLEKYYGDYYNWLNEHNREYVQTNLKDSAGNSSLPYAATQDNAYKQMEDIIAGKGGLIEATKSISTDFNAALNTYNSQLQEIAKTLGLAKDAFTNGYQGIDNDELNQLPFFKDAKEYLKDMSEQIEEAKTAMDDAAELDTEANDHLKAISNSINSWRAAYQKGFDINLQINRQAGLEDIANKPLEKYTGMGKPVEMATGGMTPAWGNEGKIAILHEKELVLNEQDTANMLQAFMIARELARGIMNGVPEGADLQNLEIAPLIEEINTNIQSILATLNRTAQEALKDAAALALQGDALSAAANLQAVSYSLDEKMTSLQNALLDFDRKQYEQNLSAIEAAMKAYQSQASSTLDQQVHIEASFPNVTQHQEIENAFNNLINMASMYASKTQSGLASRIPASPFNIS